MHTYEMIGVADQNNRIYESEFGTYSKATGFVLSDYSTEIVTISQKITDKKEQQRLIKLVKENLLDRLFHDNCWKLKVEEKEMTKEEIEKALGYKIKIKDENNKYNDIHRIPGLPCK